MTVHTGVDPRTLARLAADVAQLVDPIHVPVTQQRRYPDGRRETRAVIVTHPPLLTQLRAACEPGAVARRPERRTGPRSRPAASVDPIDTLRRIYADVGAWRARVMPGHRVAADEDPWRATLRALVGVAPTLAPAVADDLAADVHRWWRDGAIHTGWRPAQLEKLRPAEGARIAQP